VKEMECHELFGVIFITIFFFFCSYGAYINYPKPFLHFPIVSVMVAVPNGNGQNLSIIGRLRVHFQPASKPNAVSISLGS